jgi:hypothetical protein
MAYETITASSNNYLSKAEEIRPAVDIQLADALAKQAEVSSQASKAAETYLVARADWLYHKSQLDRIAEDVANLRKEQDG